MKKQHYIKKINIKNFKCFDDFKAEGFSRVNLIGGKNNVGKTAFMEACFIDVCAHDVKSFSTAIVSIKVMRENINILEEVVAKKKRFDESVTGNLMELSNGIYIDSNKKKLSYKIEEHNGVKKYIFQLNDEKIKVNIKDFTYIHTKNDNIKFIDNFGLSNGEIISNYSNIQKLDREEYLNIVLNNFDSAIKSFKIIDEKPQCKIGEEYLEISELGDGTRHLVSIVSALFSCQDGYLFIDEIDNGIHYTMLDEIWNIIFEASKTLNVQVFATTHSKAMIDSFLNTSEYLNDKEISFVELGRDKNNEVKAIVMDAKRLKIELQSGNEVRGW